MQRNTFSRSETSSTKNCFLQYPVVIYNSLSLLVPFFQCREKLKSLPFGVRKSSKMKRGKFCRCVFISPICMVTNSEQVFHYFQILLSWKLKIKKSYLCAKNYVRYRKVQTSIFFRMNSKNA